MSLGNVTGSFGASLGVKSPKEALDMIKDELVSPFRELNRNLNPKAIGQNIIHETNLDQLLPVVQASYNGIAKIFENDKKAQEDREQKKAAAARRREERANKAQEKSQETQEESKTALEAIRDRMRDVYDALTGNTAEAIAERRRQEQQKQSNDSLPTAGESPGGLRGLLMLFADPKTLLTSVGLTAAAAGLASVMGIMRFLGRFALKAGPIGIILSSLAAFNTSDFAKIAEDFSVSTEAIKDGKFFEGVTGYVKTITDIALTLLGRVSDEVAGFLTNIGVNETVASAIAGTGTGAAIGAMFGPKGALLGAILGFAYTSGQSLTDWIEEQTGISGSSDFAMSIGKGAVAGATLGSLFGPKGMLIGAIAGAAGSLLYETGSWISSLPWSEYVDFITEKLVDAYEGLKNHLYEAIIQPMIDMYEGITSDPRGYITHYIPEWMYDFGHHIWTKAVSPVVTLFSELFTDPAAKIRELIEAGPGKLLTDLGSWYMDIAINPIVDLMKEIFSAEVREKLYGLISTHAPWILDIAGWAYDTFIDPVVSIYRMIENSASNLKAKLLEAVPERLRGWIFGEDESISRPSSNTLSTFNPNEETSAIAKIRAMEDETTRWDINAVASRLNADALIPQTRQTITSNDTIIGSVSIDQSTSNSGSGPQTFGKPSTRPSVSRLDELQRGGYGSLSR